MVRLAPVVAPGLPHHITQRGNRRQETFFNAEDYKAYLALMAEWCRACAVEVWAYCLMPNHVHLIAVPESDDGLRWRLRQGKPGPGDAVLHGISMVSPELAVHPTEPLTIRGAFYTDTTN